MSSGLLKERIFDTACWLAGVGAKVLGFKDLCPIFIIGTGRCGTTLLVDILKTNPLLSGFPGEANELWHCKLEPFNSTSLNVPPIEVDPRSFCEVSIANWPPNHGERIRNVFAGFRFLTGPSKIFFTKSAMVSFMIPKILELFPDARFIHIYRFGPSVVESYFKKNFRKYSRFQFTERGYRTYCASYWNECILEIEHQKRTLSLENTHQFLEFSYESLCQQPSKTLGDVARFIGVNVGNFGFDMSRISNQNYKVAGRASESESAELLRIMSPAIRLKRYIEMDVLQGICC